MKPIRFIKIHIQHRRITTTVTVSYQYRYFIGMGIILLTLCSCKKSNDKLSSETTGFVKLAESAKASEVVQETGAAQEVLKQLHEQGRLPGDSKDQHGKITCEIPQLIISNKVAQMTYPATRTFHLVHLGETTINNYTLTKQSKDSPWKLQRAWETDSNGQVIHEWPVQ